LEIRVSEYTRVIQAGESGVDFVLKIVCAMKEKIAEGLEHRYFGTFIFDP